MKIKPWSKSQKRTLAWYRIDYAIKVGLTPPILMNSVALHFYPH